MKKIISLIAIAAASHICAAEDDFNDLLALADLSDFAGESLLFKMEQQAPLKIWADKFNAYPKHFYLVSLARLRRRIRMAKTPYFPRHKTTN